MHPLAMPGNKSGGNSGSPNEVNSGDKVVHNLTGRIGTLDECLHDGDAFVTWDDGTFDTVKWNHLSPIRIKASDYETDMDMSRGIISDWKNRAERAEEALAFYADPDCYKPQYRDGCPVRGTVALASDIQNDNYGDKARRILARSAKTKPEDKQC